MPRCALTVCFLVALVVSPAGARPDAFADAVQALNADSYDKRAPSR